MNLCKSAGTAARVWAAKRTTQPWACFAYTEGPGKAIVYTGAPRICWSTTLKYSCKSMQGFLRHCKCMQPRLSWDYSTREGGTGSMPERLHLPQSGKPQAAAEAHCSRPKQEVRSPVLHQMLCTNKVYTLNLPSQCA